ncbi:MAG: hypothetical protein ACTHLP_13155 [Rhizobiaceae bacterium]|jgi:hypothetical protein
MRNFQDAILPVPSLPTLDWSAIRVGLRRVTWEDVFRQFTVKRIAGGVAILLLILFSFGWATRNDPSEKPYLAVIGGGFIYNYREGEEFYDVVTNVQKPLAEGSIIEVTFENPAGGAPLVVSDRVSARTNRYAFHSPQIHGVVGGRPYKVEIRVYDREKTKLIWSTTRDFKSDLDDNVVPKKPVVIGPGYTPNPDR